MEEIELVLNRDKDCKHSVRFANDNPESPIQSVYINRSTPGVNEAKSVTLKLTVAGK